MPTGSFQNISLAILNLLLVISLAWSWQMSREQDREHGMANNRLAMLEKRVQDVEDEEIPPQIVLYRLKLLDEAVTKLDAKIIKVLDEIRYGTNQGLEGGPT